LFEAQRPVILTSIGEVAKRSDLLNRCLNFELPPIAASNRASEQELWREFDIARPRILGALLDAVAGALSNLPRVKLAEVPRLADFALWVSAAEPHLGWPEKSFMEAYQVNQASANDVALGSGASHEASVLVATHPGGFGRSADDPDDVPARGSSRAGQVLSGRPGRAASAADPDGTATAR
jgi:hypothetical protein